MLITSGFIFFLFIIESSQLGINYSASLKFLYDLLLMCVCVQMMCVPGCLQHDSQVDVRGKLVVWFSPSAGCIQSLAVENLQTHHSCACVPEGKQTHFQELFLALGSHKQHGMPGYGVGGFFREKISPRLVSFLLKLFL